MAARNVPPRVWFNYRRTPAAALARQLARERLARFFITGRCAYRVRGEILQSLGQGDLIPRRQVPEFWGSIIPLYRSRILGEWTYQ